MASLRCFPYLLLAAILVLTPLSGATIESCFYGDSNRGANQDVSKSVTKFGLNFFKTLVASQEGEVSLVVSPYSVWSAFCLTFFGSEGATKNQLAKVLRLPSKTTTFNNWKSLQERLAGAGKLSTTFTSTNKAYFSDHLTLDPCLTSFLPEMETLSFQQPVEAADKINAVVSAATEGEITDLVNAADLSNVEFVLLNAVFFKGRWKTLFPKESTEMKTFHATSPSVGQVTVPMMTAVGNFKYTPSEELEASLVELPYETGFSMLVLLPNVGVRAEKVVSNLSRRKLERAREVMAGSEVLMSIPRFTITTKIDAVLEQTLSDMGVVDLFKTSANLASFGPGNLLATSAVHQATVQVTEEGTVAAAATGVLGTRLGPKKFVCDRPFVFLLIDDMMGVPIITGVYNGP